MVTPVNKCNGTCSSDAPDVLVSILLRLGSSPLRGSRLRASPTLSTWQSSCTTESHQSPAFCPAFCPLSVDDSALTAKPGLQSYSCRERPVRNQALDLIPSHPAHVLTLMEPCEIVVLEHRLQKQGGQGGICALANLFLMLLASPGGARAG